MDPMTLAAAGVGAAANLIGGSMQQRESDKIAQMNIQMQKDFAQKGLEWKAADARAAEKAYGINALTLLGAPTSSFSNVAGNPDAGSGVRGAGQDISRALAANSVIQQRQADLDAKLTEAKIANINADTIQTTAKASEARLASAPGTPPGLSTTIPLTQWAVDENGNKIRIPSKEAASPLQTIASTPANLSLAVRQLGDIMRNTWETIKQNNDVLGLRDGRGVPGLVLPDVFRHTDNIQSQWFGGM